MIAASLLAKKAAATKSAADVATAAYIAEHALSDALEAIDDLIAATGNDLLLSAVEQSEFEVGIIFAALADLQEEGPE